MIAEPVQIVWKVTEPTQGLSRDHIWRMAVRTRGNLELTRFLDAMELDGACDVVVTDAQGRETHFPCGLPSGHLAETGDTASGALSASAAQ